MVSRHTLKKYLKTSNKHLFGDDVTSQAILVTTLLISQWQDGEVFDNTIFQKKCTKMLQLNYLGNWLYNYIPETRTTLDKVFWCETDNDYNNLLAKLHSIVFNETFLKKYSGKAPLGNPMNEKEGKFEIID